MAFSKASAVLKKKIDLKPGVFLLSFSMLLFRFCKQASNASPNLENPFFQNGNTPFGKSQSKIGKNRFAMESKAHGFQSPSGWPSIASAVFPKLREFGFFHNKIFRFCKNRLSVLVG